MEKRKLNRKPRVWTEVRRKELQRLLNLEWTSVQIAAHFGVTVHAVRSATKAYRLSSWEAHALRQSRRFKGCKLSDAHVEKLTEAMKRRHADPAFHNKVMEAINAPGIRKLANDRRRGFAVPEEASEHYQILRRKLGSALEAGRMLGLVGGAH